jgi:prepilin-type N-terminal cleavage/methylation domain-containing protein
LVFVPYFLNYDRPGAFLEKSGEGKQKFMKTLEKKNDAGFTIIELLVVIAIIIVLTGFTITNYHTFGREFSLERSASKLSQDIRRAQERAVAMKEVNGSLPDAYGVYLAANTPAFYTITAYELSGSSWSATDSWEVVVNLESNVEIKTLKEGSLSTSTLNIVFEAPDPLIWINDATSSSSTITLHLSTDESQTRDITVLSTGLITSE